ncbi:hypothetical protein SESBI_28521 [Sesbania bispinosa]|nr:hypothetical protein SESBI_28521 [Sesbania bispinosa]
MRPRSASKEKKTMGLNGVGKEEWWSPDTPIKPGRRTIQNIVPLKLITGEVNIHEAAYFKSREVKVMDNDIVSHSPEKAYQMRPSLVNKKKKTMGLNGVGKEECWSPDTSIKPGRRSTQNNVPLKLIPGEINIHETAYFKSRVSHSPEKAYQMRPGPANKEKKTMELNGVGKVECWSPDTSIKPGTRSTQNNFPLKLILGEINIHETAYFKSRAKMSHSRKKASQMRPRPASKEKKTVELNGVGKEEWWSPDTPIKPGRRTIQNIIPLKLIPGEVNIHEAAYFKS